MPVDRGRVNPRVPPIDVAGSIRSVRVVELLAKPMSERGISAFLCNDKGSEVSSAWPRCAG